MFTIEVWTMKINSPSLFAEGKAMAIAPLLPHPMADSEVWNQISPPCKAHRIQPLLQSFTLTLTSGCFIVDLWNEVAGHWFRKFGMIIPSVAPMQSVHVCMICPCVWLVCPLSSWLQGTWDDDNAKSSQLYISLYIFIYIYIYIYIYTPVFQ